MSNPEPDAGRDLAATVLAFAQRTRGWPDRVLESEAWAWDDYEEIRYAPLHTVMTLRALAARIRVERAQHGPLQTLAQHALADSHAAFRTLEALLAPLPDVLFDRVPAPMEYTLRTVLMYVNETELYFLATIRNALESYGGREPTEGELSALTGASAAALATGTPAQAWAAYANSHALVQEELAGLTDTQVEREATMWEQIRYPILFRMWRFGAHLREHTIQVRKTLAWLDVSANEAELHAREIYAALAEVESARLGAGEVGREACARTAAELYTRYITLDAAHDDIEQFVQAVEAGDGARVRALLAARPGLARTRVDDQVTALLHALYRGHSEIVDALQAAGIRLGLSESAAMGNTERLARLLNWYPEEKSAAGRDGFTPLQLAAYFAQPAAVRLLLEQGADPHVVSKNGQGLQAIHAAAAGRNAEVVALLIGAGADVHARQAGGFTPLAAALQNGDEAIAALLRNAGAVE